MTAADAKISNLSQDGSNDYQAITFQGEIQNNFNQQLLVFIRHVLDLTADLRDTFITYCAIG